MILIPSYLDIQLVVAQGLRGGTQAEWDAVRATFSRAVDVRALNGATGSKSEGVCVCACVRV